MYRRLPSPDEYRKVSDEINEENFLRNTLEVEEEESAAEDEVEECIEGEGREENEIGLEANLEEVWEQYSTLRSASNAVGFQEISSASSGDIDVESTTFRKELADYVLAYSGKQRDVKKFKREYYREVNPDIVSSSPVEIPLSWRLWKICLHSLWEIWTQARRQGSCRQDVNEE